jgi:hypothetical protein
LQEEVVRLAALGSYRHRRLWGRVNVRREADRARRRRRHLARARRRRDSNTRGPVKALTAFEAVPFVRSGTPPDRV